MGFEDFTYEMETFSQMKYLIHMWHELVQDFTREILVYKTWISHIRWNIYMWKYISRTKFSFHLWKWNNSHVKCNFHIWNCMWNFCKERKFEKIALNVSDTETVLPMGTDRFIIHLLWAKVQVRYICATYISKLSRFSNKKLHQSLLMYSGFRLGRTYISKHMYQVESLPPNTFMDTNPKHRTHQMPPRLKTLDYFFIHH